ncbi:MAG: molybdenum ABC transporter ATP-binding protein [Proteobacteria bacterium]|nr:molybdenum ABC transporter ATP-binding protein [Pseudomonadota bacterium]
MSTSSAKSSCCSIRLKRPGFVVEADFVIPEKGVLGIFGHSGSGKTTLLRCLAGLEVSVEGRIEINGEVWLDEARTLSIQKRNIGYVFQEGRLFPHLSVLKNLAYGESRKSSGREGSAVSQAADGKDADRQDLLELLDITHLLKRYPAQLSGGEQQRVAIARALLKKPQMLLLDEPLVSLDENRKQEILPYLEKLHETLNIPILYVSHNMDEMLRLCDRMLVIENGKLVCQGDIHEVLVSPQSPLANVLADGQHAAAVLEGTVSKQEKPFSISTVHTVNGNAFQVPGLLPIGKHVRLIVFASDVSLAKHRAQDSSILNIIAGDVAQVLDRKDGRVLLQINCNNDIVLSLISQKSYELLRLESDGRVFIQVKAVVTKKQ